MDKGLILAPVAAYVCSPRPSSMAFSCAHWQGQGYNRVSIQSYTIRALLALLVKWSSQIEVFIGVGHRDTHSIGGLPCGGGPLSLLLFWKTCTTAPLSPTSSSASDVQLVVTALAQVAKGPPKMVPADLAAAIQRWRDIGLGAHSRLRMTALDSVKYLGTLERCIEPLYLVADFSNLFLH